MPSYSKAVALCTLVTDDDFTAKYLSNDIVLVVPVAFGVEANNVAPLNEALVFIYALARLFDVVPVYSVNEKNLNISPTETLFAGINPLYVSVSAVTPVTLVPSVVDLSKYLVYLLSKYVFKKAFTLVQVIFFNTELSAVATKSVSFGVALVEPFIKEPIVLAVSFPVLVPLKLVAVIEPVKVSPALLAGVYPHAFCLPLNVLQSVELNAPLLVADAVGKLNV